MPVQFPENDEKLAAVIRGVLDLPASVPAEGLSRENYPEWDSLRHVKLMLELQKKFGVRFAAADILRLNSYREIRDELARRQ